MLPTDSSLLPPVHVSVGFFAAMGLFTPAIANLVHKQSFFFSKGTLCFSRDLVGPHTLLVGGVLGAVGGLVLHHGATGAHERLSVSRAYQDRYQASERR